MFYRWRRFHLAFFFFFLKTFPTGKNWRRIHQGPGAPTGFCLGCCHKTNSAFLSLAYLIFPALTFSSALVFPALASSASTPHPSFFVFRSRTPPQTLRNGRRFDEPVMTNCHGAVQIAACASSLSDCASSPPLRFFTSSRRLFPPERARTTIPEPPNAAAAAPPRVSGGFWCLNISCLYIGYIWGLTQQMVRAISSFFGEIQQFHFDSLSFMRGDFFFFAFFNLQLHLRPRFSSRCSGRDQESHTQPFIWPRAAGNL